MNFAIVIHFFHDDSIDEILKVYSTALKSGIDIYISVSPDKSLLAKSLFPRANLGIFPNQGYDILPFLRIANKFNLFKYDFIIKLHTKNLSRNYSKRMFKIYFERLSSPVFLNNTFSQFFNENRDVGLISVLEFCRSIDSLMYGNREQFDLLSKKCGVYALPKSDDIFFAGTMFAIRGEILKDIGSLVNTVKFSSESLSQTGADGSIAHTLERFIPFFSQKKGYSYAIITPQFLHTNRQSHVIHQKHIWSLVPKELLHCGSNSLSSKSENLQKYVHETKLDNIVNLDAYKKSLDKKLTAEYSINFKAHYLLFSDLYSNRLPAEQSSFSAASYRCLRPDVYRSEVPGVWHWYTRGHREKNVEVDSNTKYLLSFDNGTSDPPRTIIKQKKEHEKVLNKKLPDPLLTDRVSLALDHNDYSAVEKHTLKFLQNNYVRLDYIELLALSLVKNKKFGQALFFWRLFEFVKVNPSYSGQKSFKRLASYDKTYDVAKIFSGKGELIAYTRSSLTFPRNSICVYTTLFGDYDKLPCIPSNLIGKIDFIIFTDQYNSSAQDFDGWKVVKCDKQFDCSNLSAKIYKIKPSLYLNNYEYSIFIDANTEIYSNFLDLVGYLWNNASRFSMFPHPYRQSLTEEACAIISFSKYSAAPIIKQLEDYINFGFKEVDSCLCEGSFMWRSHRCPRTIEFMDMWWEQILLYSKRDQMSLTYLMQAQNFYPSIIDPAIGSSRDNKFFRKILHVHEQK